jgi:hypothetical protein
MSNSQSHGLSPPEECLRSAYGLISLLSMERILSLLIVIIKLDYLSTVESGNGFFCWSAVSLHILVCSSCPDLSSTPHDMAKFEIKDYIIHRVFHRVSADNFKT